MIDMGLREQTDKEMKHSHERSASFIQEAINVLENIKIQNQGEKIISFVAPKNLCKFYTANAILQRSLSFKTNLLHID